MKTLAKVGVTSNSLWGALSGVGLLFVCSKYGTTVREIPYTDMILFRRTPLAVNQSTHGFFFSIHIFFKFCGPICLIFLIKNQKKMVHKRKNLSKTGREITPSTAMKFGPKFF